MLTRAEETKLRRDQIEDHLSDRDDFAALAPAEQEAFLLWSDTRWVDFYDASTVDGEWRADFAIEPMFDAWRQQAKSVAA